RSSEAEMDREIQMLIVDEAMRDGLDPDDPDDLNVIRQSMLDPNSEYYQKALKRWLHGEAVQIGARYLAGPFRPRMRPVNEEGEDLYHSFSRDIKSLVNTADTRVIQLDMQADGYYSIGTDHQRRALREWTYLAYDDVENPVTLNGRTYSPAEINAMNDDQRRRFADAVMAERGWLDDINDLRDERAKFLADPENKEFAQFDTWASEVRDYPGGVDKYWHDAAEENDAAAAYYEQVLAEDLSESERHRRLTSLTAYMNLRGYHRPAWDPIPPSTSKRYGGVYDPVEVASGPAKPQPYQEPNAEFRDEVRKAPQVLAELEQWDRAVAEEMEARGIDPSIPFNELPTETRVEIEEALEERGITEPEVPWQVRKYIEWAEQQPPGADTSVEAYFEAERREYESPEAALERFEKEMQTPSPLPSPDAQGRMPESTADDGNLWRSILDLMNEHDHKRYGDSSGGGGRRGGGRRYGGTSAESLGSTPDAENWGWLAPYLGGTPSSVNRRPIRMPGSGGGSNSRTIRMPR